MSRRSPAVIDLGPLHLRSGGDDQSSISHPASPRQADIARLEALLNGSTMSREQSRDYSEEDLAFFPKNISMSDEASRLDALSQEMSIAAAQISTYVNLELQDDTLKGIQLIVFEAEGRLHFELVLKDEKHRAWLIHQLQNLATEVGSRLNRSVRIHLIGNGIEDLKGKWAEWNERNDC